MYYILYSFNKARKNVTKIIRERKTFTLLCYIQKKKKIVYRWTHAVQTHLVQGSTVVYSYLFYSISLTIFLSQDEFLGCLRISANETL